MKVINKYMNFLIMARVTFTLTIISLFSLNSYAQNNKVRISETANELTIGNNLVELTFSKTSEFDIESIKMGSRNLLSATRENTMPWILTYRGVKGENPELNPSYGDYKGYTINKVSAGISIVFKWDMKLSYKAMYPVFMIVTMYDNSELVHWDIKTELPTGWVVTKLQFPRIAVDTPIKGKIITSAGWGNEYDIRAGGSYVEDYPSHTGSMQLLIMHNSKGSFYYATEDRNACGKEIKADCDGKSMMFATETVPSENWSKANNFFLPWSTVTGFTTNNWQQAVRKWYVPFTYTTEWGKKSLVSRHIPKWLYNTDLWIRAKGVNDSVMNAVMKTIDYYGQGTAVHWYYWHHFPYDTHYPDYFPAKSGFKKMIKKIRDKKCYVVPYINGRLWDPETTSYNTMNGQLASCRKADGTLYTEIYPTSKVLNTVTCPASETWQKIIPNLVDKIQRELNTNGVYIDQVAAAAPLPCWANNHGHAKGGGDFWFKAYRRMMENIRSNHLLKNNILITEENAECCIDLFDLLLTVNTPHEDCRIVPLFPMVYSGRALTVGFTYTPTDKLTGGDFCYENTMCFLYGSQLGWVDPTLLMRKESSGEAAFLKELVCNRKKCHSIFNRGRFVEEITPEGDNPTTDIKGFGTKTVVRAAKWISQEGKPMIFIVNMDKKEHEVILPGDSQPIMVKAKKVVIKY
jgi:hypothetical protein